jgi:mono/diheme cytochrome c family protein
MSFATRVRTLLTLVGALAILVGIVAAAFFLGGFYSVAADSSDPNFVNWALIHVREASIARHATGQPPIPFEDPTLVRAGVRAYSEIGCVNCHGGPGVEPANFSDGLNPPPNLKKVINDLQPQEVFWVIKHGIKMTGMPSFGARNPPVPDQTIWSIVAFLKRVPSVSDEEFKAWSEPN